MAPPSISNTISLISRGAEHALTRKTNAFLLNPSSWTDRPSTGLGPPWPVKTEKAIKLANAIADAFVALGGLEDEEDQRWGGGDDKGEVPDPPHGARGDDNLPFDDAGFVDDSPDDTIPDYHRRRPAQPSSRSSHRLAGARVWTPPQPPFVTNVTPCLHEADRALARRANASRQGFSSWTDRTSASLRYTSAEQRSRRWSCALLYPSAAERSSRAAAAQQQQQQQTSE